MSKQRPKHSVLQSILSSLTEKAKQRTQLTSHLQYPAPTDRDGWIAYWRAQDQPWHTEPETEKLRQEELTKCRAITPDIRQGIYPFKGVKLKRSDVEWLLATHENGLGPVYWNNPSHHERYGLDLRGANLNGEDLRHLPLARLRGGLSGDDWRRATPDQRHMAAIHLERAILTYTHLEGSILTHAYLQGAVLNEAHLESVDAFEAHFEAPIPVSWHGAYFDVLTKLNKATIANDKHIGPRLFDVHWDGVNLTGIDWTSIPMVLDEYRARKRTTEDGEVKTKQQRDTEYEEAVLTYRQLSGMLQSQGLSEDAARFVYRAQNLQRAVLWRQRKFGQFLFSLFLYLTTGYGYRVWRSFVTYLLVIGGFATAYYLLGLTDVVGPHHIFGPHHLAWYEAIVVSMTAFHGRGFLADQFKPGDPQAFVAAFEAFVGLIIEVTFIATLTRRLFGQ